MSITELFFTTITKGVTIYRYIGVSFCRFDIPVRLMRIPVYRYTHSSPVFYTYTACLTHVNRLSNMHQAVQFLAFRSVFSWDNFTATSPITNNMTGRSYDFNLMINTKAKNLNYGFIQV